MNNVVNSESFKIVGEYGKFRLLEWEEGIIDVFGKIKSDGHYLDKHYNDMKKEEVGCGRYVLVDTKDDCVVGYFGISPTHISYSNDTADKYKHVLMNQKSISQERYLNRDYKWAGGLSLDLFAVDEKYKSKNKQLTLKNKDGSEEKIRYSDFLMAICIKKLEEMAKALGSYYVVLSATPVARGLYVRTGFQFFYKDDYKQFIKERPEYATIADYICEDIKIHMRIGEETCVPMILNLSKC